MKKLLLGSAALTLFAISIFIFQVSCKKEATAQTGSTYILPPATTTTLGGVKPDGITILVDGTGKISTATSSSTDIILYTKSSNSGPITYEYWVANRDGSVSSPFLVQVKSRIFSCFNQNYWT